MRFQSDTYTLSATDLANFLGCRHRTALEMEASAGIRKRPHFDDPILELLFQRGTDHEKSYVDSLRQTGLSVVELTPVMKRDELLAATLDAMRAGHDVIVQGALADDGWFGKPDLLMRVPRPSALGDWSYEVSDTKLARETHAGAILQLGLYSAMLAKAQGLAPEYFHVVTPNPEHPIHTFRVDDYSAYFRLVRDQLAETVKRTPIDIATTYYPDPVEHCHICPWSGQCDAKRHVDDHLSLVAGITRTQRRELATRGTGTLSELGRLVLPIPFKPDRGSVASYIRVREQARLQMDSRGIVPPLHELRDIVENQGLCRLPEPSPGDIFLDLEGDNLANEGGREYLFGFVTFDKDGAPEYTALWGRDDREERASFEAVMDIIGEAIAEHPGMHVYHYAPYEITNFKRLMGRYATRTEALDGMLRAGRFVDLYAVVHQGIRAGIEGYSIKNLEPLYGFTRDVELPEASRALRQFEYALAIGALDSLPPEVAVAVERYNRDDCISTLRLRDWLEVVREVAVLGGAEIARPVAKPPEPSKDLGERQKRTEELRARLLNGIEGMPLSGTPEHARWMLAYLLDFHRREDKAGWWKYFDMCEATDEKLMDEPEAVAGLVHDRRVGLVFRANTQTPTGSVIDRYTYAPQEMEIRSGAELKNRDGTKFGDVVGADRLKRALDVKKGKAKAEEHPVAVFSHKYISSETMEDSIAAVGDRVAESAGFDGANGIVRALMLREPPRLASGGFLQPENADVSQYAVDIVGKLDNTVLAIQGPPGSGKTYTGARMILALVAVGKKVGVLGPSHKVISNLLEEVTESARRDGIPMRVAQKCGKDEGELPECIGAIKDNDEALRVLVEREIDVLGGTAWLWARSDMAGAVDVLFVDEAGQVPLANAIAVSTSARSMVLLGDPQQLDQPQKGSHPDGVDASVLQHVLGEDLTIPRERGIFLPITWRLSPSISAFTSELFYASRLASKPSLERQVLTGVDELAGSGLWCLDVAHDGRTSSSDEEVEAVAHLVATLTREGSSWVGSTGSTAQLRLGDVLVVSPFNAQVSRLVERLPTGARVGTVDKFQGQEAPVVIYSMATSRPEDAPRGMEFLYSLNRLNVATSRARCAVVIVANPRLFEPECHSPRQMKLANALCRYREMGKSLAPGT